MVQSCHWRASTYSSTPSPPPALCCCSCRMDTRRFYAEARRLLKPSGTLAIWGYGLASLPPEQAAAEGLLLK